MSAIIRPVGPEPRGVYWRRRLVVLAVLAALVILAWSVLSGGGDGAAARGDQTPSPTSAAPVDCAASDLSVTVTPARTDFGPGVPATFAVTIANTSARACTVDGGAAARQVLVTSGSDRIWSSTDCPDPNAQSRLLLLDAGARDASELTWDRTRSAEGCPADLPAPRPGTYRITATVAGVTSVEAVFTLD